MGGFSGGGGGGMIQDTMNQMPSNLQWNPGGFGGGPAQQPMAQTMGMPEGRSMSYGGGGGGQANPYQNYGAHSVAYPGQSPQEWLSMQQGGGSSYGMSSYRQPSPMFGGMGAGQYGGAWPGQGYGGMPGRFGQGQGGGWGGFNQWGGGGGGYPGGAFGAFGNFNFGPGSYSPYGAGSMGYGGGSGMYGGFGGGYQPFNPNMWAQQQVGPTGQYTPTQFTRVKPPPKPTKSSPLRRLGGFQIGGDRWGGGGRNGGGGGGNNGGGGSGCFAYGTRFKMADGSIKEVQDLAIGDEMATGGRVSAVIQGDGALEEWFDYHGVEVTGGHPVFEGDKWVRVKDAEDAVPIDGHDVYYTVANANHYMTAENGVQFTDYFEIDLDDFEDELLAKLNQRVPPFHRLNASPAHRFLYG